MPPPTRDMTETLLLSAGEDDLGLPPCRKTMYEELGETVMPWLGALTTTYEHGVARLNQKTMVMPGVPVDGVMDVYNDHNSVQLVFENAAHAAPDGRATLRTEDALKADQLCMESTRSTNNIYLWHR